MTEYLFLYENTHHTALPKVTSPSALRKYIRDRQEDKSSSLHLRVLPEDPKLCCDLVVPDSSVSATTS